jgi:hypothetical protein
MSEATAVVDKTSITKVRGFVICKTTGSPLAGVPVTLWAEVDEGIERPLGLLTSDGAGYVSFDITKLPSRPVSFILKSPRFDEAIKVLYGSVRPDRPCFVASARPAGRGDAPAITSSMQNPDLTDLAISPRSFANNGATQAGSCGAYSPGQTATRDINILRTVLTPESVTDAMWPERPAGMSVEGSAVLPADYALPMARLVVLRQRWWYVGATLGDIVYSLPLAPGETVQLATVEWNRRDRLTRTDSITSLEHLHHDLTRDRTLGETVSAALSETQNGYSLMGGTSTSSSAGASLSLQDIIGFPLNIAAGASGIIGAAGSVAVSSGDRTINAESTQILNDSINQSAWAMRSLNSTVVVQADQVEGSTVQTRAVTNNNRCHALTVQYYEVLRTFRVETWWERTDAGVLIPYDDFTFTPAVVLRHRLTLEAALLTPSLGSAFDALARVTITPEVYDAATSPTPASTGPKFAEGRHTFNVPATDSVPTGLTIEQGSTVHIIATGNVKFGADIGPGYTADGANDAADSGYPAPGLRRLSLVCRIGNAWHQGGVSTEFTASDEGTMSLQANDYDLSNNSGTWSVTVVITRPAAATTGQAVVPVPVQLSRTADESASKLLVRHLNDNAPYYSRAIWLLMDAGERRALLEQFLASNRGLLARLGDTPITTFGKWLIFSLVRATVMEGEEIDPYDYRRVQLVSLPSRGLLAEAELGSCNACEERDVTRAMDWPLTQPTPITGVTPGPQGQTPTAPQPASLPAPIVAIQQAPSAPDPVGLAGALGLLGQPNIFRDMSGLQQVSQLLDDLVNGTVSETNAALRAASARAALRGSGADSSGGTGGAPSRRSAPSTNDPGRQVDRLNAIQYARNQDPPLITDAQANDAAVGVVGGEVVPASFAEGDIRDAYGWRELIQFQVPQAIQSDLRNRNMRVQLFEEAIGAQINLDYFPVLIRKFPSVNGTQLNAEGLIREIRLGMTGESPLFVDPYYSTFQPYEAVDTAKWESNDPTGTVVFIDILGPDNAAVVISRATDQFWIFSTIWTPRSGQHPVTGHRLFGIQENGTGDFVVFTKGADLSSGFLESQAGVRELATFEAGERLWLSFQQRIVAWVKTHDGEAVAQQPHSQRYDWMMVRALLSRQSNELGP